MDACQRLIEADGWEPTFDEVWDMADASVGFDIETADEITADTKANPSAYGPCHVAVVTRDLDIPAVVLLLDRRLRRYGRSYSTHRTLEAALSAIRGLPTA